jgi:hypothetical protein
MLLGSLFLLTLSVEAAGAADRNHQNSAGVFIATTGRIVNVDVKNKTMRVREPGTTILVLITDETLIQDGSAPIVLDDFTAGEIISIHGRLAGTTVTASRIAKWL